MINSDNGYTLSVNDLKEIATKHEGYTIDTPRITLCDKNNDMMAFIWVSNIVVWSNRIECYIGSNYIGCILYDYFNTIDILNTNKRGL